MFILSFLSRPSLPLTNTWLVWRRQVRFPTSWRKQNMNQGTRTDRLRPFGKLYYSGDNSEKREQRLSVVSQSRKPLKGRWGDSSFVSNETFDSGVNLLVWQPRLPLLQCSPGPLDVCGSQWSGSSYSGAGVLFPGLLCIRNVFLLFCGLNRNEVFVNFWSCFRQNLESIPPTQNH